MADSRKASTAPASEDEAKNNITVTPRKEIRPNGTLKLKRPAPKHNKPGNWRDGSVVDDDKKAKPSTTNSPSTNSITSPGPVVTQLDDNARDTFGTGRPLEDSPELILCKHCKKSVLKASAKAHVDSCLANKKELQRKRKEAKEKAKARAEGGESKAGDDDDKDTPAKDGKDGAKDVKEKKEKIKKSDKEKDKAKESDKIDKATLDEEGDTRMGGNDDEDDDADPIEEATPAPKKTPSGLKSAKKTAGKKAGDDGEKKGKKRKLDPDAEKGPKAKKKKEEPKLKAPKPKVPVDVERQCGVITPQGLPCARSLTCKSHSMGAKRAVPGRSLPYDMLLSAYQKKNQAKQQKAAIDANAPLEDADDPAAGPVDSDEETQAVLGALGRWNPQPLVRGELVESIRRRYQIARLREQLDSATSGGAVNIFKVVSKNGVTLPEYRNQNAGGIGGSGGGGGAVGGDEDAQGDIDYAVPGSAGGTVPGSAGGVRRPTAGLGAAGGSGGGGSAAFGLQAPPLRKQSVAAR